MHFNSPYIIESLEADLPSIQSPDCLIEMISAQNLPQKPVTSIQQELHTFQKCSKRHAYCLNVSSEQNRTAPSPRSSIDALAATRQAAVRHRTAAEWPGSFLPSCACPFRVWRFCVVGFYFEAPECPGSLLPSCICPNRDMDLDFLVGALHTATTTSQQCLKQDLDDSS